jgi:hypothetical protein
MSLGNDQRHFTKMIATLIAWAYENGFELTFGDAYRDPRVHGEVGEKQGYGHSRSYHKRRLAVDFNLFRDGVWLNKTSDFKPLGEYWESIGGTWGGRFDFDGDGQGDDGNHFSYTEQRGSA